MRIVILLFSIILLCGFTVTQPVSVPVSQPVAVLQSADELLPSVSVSPYLDGVIDSTVADLDATITDSYSGSGQTWSNLIASPADGASQTDYDFFLGLNENIDVSDPTFMIDRFVSLGNDILRPKDLASATVFDRMSRTDTTGTWIAWAGLINSTGIGSFQAIWGTSWGSAQDGVYFYTNPGNLTWRFWQAQGGSRVIGVTNAPLVLDTPVVVVVSFDSSSTTNNIRIWVNTGTAETVSLDFVDGTTLSSADGQEFNVMAASNNGSPSGTLPANSYTRHISAGNEFLTNEQAAAIIAHLETRHGIDYTP